ncbi:MAG: cytochrome d ubiquinol oxidase subunit II [Chloroflexi bacterium]|nr:MAG: cytochrome d ubiquinol oxidase subunit II [Chloroflexota bacterium]
MDDAGHAGRDLWAARLLLRDPAVETCRALEARRLAGRPCAGGRSAVRAAAGAVARGGELVNLVPDLIAVALLLSITAYSTAGGVDFGAGIWDLLAGQSARGRQARALIDHAMAPVWEVNNVWLVMAIVLCWTGFPLLFQSTFLSLYPLFALALVGLILRGAFFAFRHVADEPRSHRIADLVFGASSVLTPFFFAASLGAIASGQVGVNGPSQSVLAASFNPMSISFGLVSVAATAFSGASFLVLIVMGSVALVTIGLQAPALLRSMLAGRGLPFALATMILTPLVAVLHARAIFRWYRVLTVAAVGSMVMAWGFAQSPYMLPGRLTIAQAIAPPGTQALLLIVGAGLVVVIVPAMALLYYLDQRSALDAPEA